MNEGLNLYWGDLHIHSAVSRRCFKFGLEPRGYDGSPADCHRYARDEAGMDFSAVTDHDCTHEKREMTADEWEEVLAAADEYDRPPHHVAFPGFEYSNRRQGHYHVVFSHGDVPMLGVDEFPTPTDLWQALDREDPDALTIPHHIARRGMPNDWSYFNRRYEPVVEICSIWGCYEHAGNPFECDPNWSASEPSGFARVGLGRGWRFGFVGGGDIHDGRAGGDCFDWRSGKVPERWRQGARYRRNPLGGGLAGVYAEKLTREALLDAMRLRRTIATTGRRTEASIEVDGTLMGGEIDADRSQIEERHLEVFARSDSTLRSIEIIRNGHILIRFRCSGESGRVEFVDRFPLTDVTPVIRSSADRPMVYYYARVTREDDHMAWTSPVWLLS